MGKMKLYMALAFCGIFFLASAQTVVTEIETGVDEKFLAAILTVATAQEAVERQTNEYLDSLHARQAAIAFMTTEIFVVQKSYESALKNTSDFEQGTDFYDYVHNYSSRISQLSDDLKDAVKKTAYENKTSFMNEVDKLVERANELIDSYDNIVINGKGDNKKDKEKADDGYNTFSRLERLDAAKAIGKELVDIYSKMVWMRDCFEAVQLCYNPSAFKDGAKHIISWKKEANSELYNSDGNFWLREGGGKDYKRSTKYDIYDGIYKNWF